MAKRQNIQEGTAISKRTTCTPSGYTKQSALVRRGVPGMPAEDGKARLSPYLKAETSLRPKNSVASAGLFRSDTRTTPACGEDTVPCTEDPTPPLPTSMACTFVDSVISLCRTSIASCREMSEPVPDEGMFLLLVGLCGVYEARYWADTLGFEHKRSYALLSSLLCGKQFSDAPNVVC